jgi:hypothetical protein
MALAKANVFILVWESLAGIIYYAPSHFASSDPTPPEAPTQQSGVGVGVGWWWHCSTTPNTHPSYLTKTKTALLFF